MSIWDDSERQLRTRELTAEKGTNTQLQKGTMGRTKRATGRHALLFTSSWGTADLYLCPIDLNIGESGSNQSLFCCEIVVLRQDQ